MKNITVDKAELRKTGEPFSFEVNLADNDGMLLEEDLTQDPSMRVVSKTLHWRPDQGELDEDGAAVMTAELDMKDGVQGGTQPPGVPAPEPLAGPAITAPGPPPEAALPAYSHGADLEGQPDPEEV